MNKFLYIKKMCNFLKVYVIFNKNLKFNNKKIIYGIFIIDSNTLEKTSY